MPHPAEKGRNLEAVNIQQPTVAKPDLGAMTYVQNADGNIVPGPGVGITTTQQPDAMPESGSEKTVTTPDTGNQQKVDTPESGQKTVVTTPEVNPADGRPQNAYEEQKAQPQQFEFNWENTSLDEVLASSDRPVRDIILDYQKWCSANGVIPDYMAIHEAIQNKDIKKSTHQNEVDEKKQARKEKWDQFGNFLLHLGNFAGGLVGGGDYSLKLENPVKYTERQRLLKEKTQALRNAYNKDFLNDLYRQRSLERQMEIDKANAQYKDAQARTNQQKADDNTRKTNVGIRDTESKINERETLLPYKTDKYQADTEYKKVAGKVAQQNTNIRQQNANANSYRTYNPTTSTTYDANGNIVKNTVNTRGGSGKGKPLGIGVGKGKGKSLGLGIGKN